MTAGAERCRGRELEVAGDAPDGIFQWSWRCDGGDGVHCVFVSTEIDVASII